MTAPNAPTLYWVSGYADTKPDFDIALPMGAFDDTDAAAGDVLVVERDGRDAGGSWFNYFSDTLSAVDATVTGISETATGLAFGNYLFRARLEASRGNSSWSASVLVTLSGVSSVGSIAVTNPGKSKVRGRR